MTTPQSFSLPKGEVVDANNPAPPIPFGTALPTTVVKVRGMEHEEFSITRIVDEKEYEVQSLRDGKLYKVPFRLCY